MIEDGQRNAPLQVRESETGAPFRGIFIAINHRPSGRTAIGGEDSVEFAQQSFDHAALMHSSAVTISNADAIIVAATLESVPLEFHRRVGDEYPRPAKCRPGMSKATVGKPFVLRAHRMGKAKSDRQNRWFLQSQAET